MDRTPSVEGCFSVYAYVGLRPTEGLMQMPHEPRYGAATAQAGRKAIGISPKMQKGKRKLLGGRKTGPALCSEGE
jgi:hypothetical protein